MITLAISTASSTESLAVFSDDKKRNGPKLISEIRWKGRSDESKKLLTMIMRLLKKAHIDFGEIDRIIVVSGPGPFSALRIGVTVAATLAYSLKIPLYEIDTPGLWRARLPADISSRQAVLLIHAGGNFISRSGGTMDKRAIAKGIFKADEILHGLPADAIFYGDITQKEMLEFRAHRKSGQKFIPEHKLKTFGETMVELAESGSPHFKKSVIVRPKYWKPPSIGVVATA